MKHTAKYLDSGFYVISDRAAGELVRANGWALPRRGWCKPVPLSIAGQLGTAELIRTDVRHSVLIAKRPARGWVWALHAFRTTAEEFPGSGVMRAFGPLGREFTFTARQVSATQSAQIGALTVKIEAARKANSTTSRNC